MHAQGGALPDFSHIMCPYSFELKDRDESEEDFGLRAANALKCGLRKLARTKLPPLWPNLFRALGASSSPQHLLAPYPGNLQ